MNKLNPKLVERVGGAFAEALGQRLVAVVAHGSATMGDIIPGFSDLDVVVFTHGAPTPVELRRLREQLQETDLGPLEYIQWKVTDLDSAATTACLVPGGFHALCGDIDGSWVLDEEGLRASGRAWLAVLPALTDEDERSWAVEAPGTPRERRQLRLLLTRLKPAVRAMLVERGEPVRAVWTAAWDDLAERWSRFDPEAADRLRDALAGLSGASRVDRRTVFNATRFEDLGWNLIWLARRAVAGATP